MEPRDGFSPFSLAILFAMNSDSRFRRPVGSRIPLRAASVALLLAAIFALAFFWRNPLTGALARALPPVGGARAVLSASAGGIGAWFSSKAALERENVTLKAELTHAQAELADRDALYAENLALKKSFGRIDAAPGRVLADVIMRPPGVPYDMLLVDAGTRQGVALGALVSGGGSTVIGTVSDVYDSTARVALFSSPGAQYSALLRGTVPVSIEGNGGGSFSGKVPAATQAAVGDHITLLGIAGGFAGTISAIKAPEGDSFKTLYFHLPVDLFELRYVEVWKR